VVDVVPPPPLTILLLPVLPVVPVFPVVPVLPVCPNKLFCTIAPPEAVLADEDEVDVGELPPTKLFAIKLFEVPVLTDVPLAIDDPMPDVEPVGEAPVFAEMPVPAVVPVGEAPGEAEVAVDPTDMPNSTFAKLLLDEVDCPVVDPVDPVDPVVP